ncbi:MAG TPA: TetR/AcrR family transcriptional regulator [Euzebyales bacterium]|nr:TetR/AcrR family transcriptional regulator [Euzebyales bacterium]
MATTQTTSAILDAAEQLFALHGVDATSIREITRVADVNVAAVHYHFGTKEAVLRAVTDRVVGPMNTRRFRLLERAQDAAAPRPPDIDAVIEAFVRPDIETLMDLQRRGPTVAHFLGRVYSDQKPWIRRMAGEQFAEVGERFFPAIAVALPHLRPDEIAWRMAQVTALVVHTFATWPEAGMDAAGAERRIARLCAFITPALRAPAVPERTEVTTGTP